MDLRPSHTISIAWLAKFGWKENTPTPTGCDAHLPTGAVDGLEASANHLHGLVAGERAQRGHIRLLVYQLPQLLRAYFGERVLDLEAALQPLHVLLFS